MQYSRKNKRGFTLIELLVVIAIVSVLASVTLVTVNSVRANARDAKRLNELNQIRNALLLYYADNGKYPIVSDYYWISYGTYEGVFSGTADGSPNPAWEDGTPVGGGSGLGAQLQPYLAEIPADPINDRDNWTFRSGFEWMSGGVESSGDFGYFYISSASGDSFNLVTWLEKTERLWCGPVIPGVKKGYPLLCPQGAIDAGRCYSGVAWCSYGSGGIGLIPGVPFVDNIYSIRG